ncbi:hypothetical protein H1R20_g2030, partial [Candolleomyces eurysporus]
MNAVPYEPGAGERMNPQSGTNTQLRRELQEAELRAKLWREQTDEMRLQLVQSMTEASILKRELEITQENLRQLKSNQGVEQGSQDSQCRIHRMEEEMKELKQELINMKRELGDGANFAEVRRRFQADSPPITTITGRVSETKFRKTVEIIRFLPVDGAINPTQDDPLHFYKYYKQATFGDVNIPRPMMLDFIGKAKWDAWNSVKGVSREDAYKAYVGRFIEILKSVNNAESKRYIAEIEAV